MPLVRLRQGRIKKKKTRTKQSAVLESNASPPLQNLTLSSKMSPKRSRIPYSHQNATINAKLSTINLFPVTKKK